MIKTCTPVLRRQLHRVLLLGMLLPAMAAASSQLALAKGCYNCHGEPPRKGVPAFSQLANNSYAKYRGQSDAARKLAHKLREGSMFGHIAAHERLSTEDAETLMQWVIDGAK